MKQTHFPTTTEGMTPDWATETLKTGGTINNECVTELHISPIGEQGQTSQVLRLNLSYDSPSDNLPSSIIAKVASSHPEVRAAQQALGSYSREIFFYQDFGTDAGISIPYCFGANIDLESGDFLLLIEDMSQCRVGDLWSSKITDIHQATEAMAHMHAKWWCDSTLREYKWLPQHDDQGFYQLLGNAYQSALPIALQKYPDHFAGYLQSLALKLSDNFESWIRYEPGAPFTLVHNDFHPKQLFFPTALGGRFAVFDWQNVIAGRPTFDLSRLLLKGLRPAELRAHKDELLKLYTSILKDSGINISLETVTAEWRSSLLHTLAYTVFVLARTDVKELNTAASTQGVDYRERLISDLAESLADYHVHDTLTDYS